MFQILKKKHPVANTVTSDVKHRIHELFPNEAQQ